MIANVDEARRRFLKSNLLAGAAALMVPSVGRSAPEAPDARLRLPEEANVLGSKEYGQQRIRKVQQAVKARGLDAIVISNRSLDYIGYASNFYPSALQPGVLFVPAEGPPTLYIQMYSSIHARSAKQTIWIDDVVAIAAHPISESNSINFYNELIKKIRDRKLTRGRIGLAGGEEDWLLPGYLRTELPGLRTEDANPLLWGLVIVKDNTELAVMRHGQKVIDDVLYPQYLKSIKEGAIDADVQLALLWEALKTGVDTRSTVSFGAAPPTSGTWAGPIANRAIERGDIILSEPITYVKRYNVEKMFTFAVGQNVPEAQKRAAQVVHDSFLIALEELKPGREMRPIFEKCNNFIKSSGYKEGSTVLIGHWIGVGNHEGARITSEGTKGLILQPGMVLSWHPSVVIPDEVRTCSSACLLITDKGVENMSKIPLEPMYYV
jgi:Xaa-Pro aminopeptidase